MFSHQGVVSVESQLTLRVFNRLCFLLPQGDHVFLLFFFHGVIRQHFKFGAASVLSTYASVRPAFDVAVKLLQSIKLV